MNPTNLEDHRGEMCVDCLFLLANGEVPDDRPDLADEIDAQWPAVDGWELSIACEEDCEGSFSWSSCDACGSTLGGERHPFAAMRQEVDADYLAAMVAGYVECALWAGLDWSGMAEGDGNPRPLDKAYSADDIAAETLAEIREECRQFIAANADDLREMDPEQAGHDFHLTRNHHGAGFWDRGLGARGDRLTTAAHAWGSSELTPDGSGHLIIG